MTTGLPNALSRAIDLLVDPPANPDASLGYLDLLPDAPATDATPKNTGAIQAAWASRLGSMLYDNAQAFARKYVGAWQLSVDWLDIPAGGVALDIGSGPGNVTASLARAVDAQAGPNVGFIRADAQRLPFRDGTFDAVTSLAVLQLIPDPSATLAEIARVLKPGGRVAIMVPTAGRGPDFLKWLPKGGVTFFAEDELGDTFEGLGLLGVRTKTIGNIQWVRGRRP